jgi:4-oxalomesaconate tautomerase
MGKMDVIVDFKMNGTEFNHISAGLIRTCRKIAEGLVYVPNEIWKGEKK